MSDLAKLLFAIIFVLPQLTSAQAGIYEEEEMTNQSDVFRSGAREVIGQ